LEIVSVPPTLLERLRQHECERKCATRHSCIIVEVDASGDSRCTLPNEPIRLLETIQLDEKAGSHDEENQKDFFNKEWFPGVKTAAPKDGEKVKVGDKEIAFKAHQADDL